MVHYAKQNSPSEKTQADSLAVARSTQKPGQTKAQTKLIAKGIENGIEVYKKQQKAKAREQNKRAKKEASTPLPAATSGDNAIRTPPASGSTGSNAGSNTTTGNKLPWLLLALSWMSFGVYWVMMIKAQ
ncbi:MAG: hypothetical protein ACI9W6_000956 [Motiliproteus sp.]|jgi:hypothetical protein